MSATTVRAFVGIALPEACRALAARLGKGVAALSRGPASPVREATVHLTLKFLGDVPTAGPDGIDAVAAALGAVVFAPFALRFGGGGFFPDMVRPRVVWAGLAAGAPECQALAARVDAALAPCGIAPEARPYRPHLTLARLREPGRGGDWPGALTLLTDAVWPETPVAAMTLWRSLLSPAGARHEVMATFAASTG
ncbi:RNA 2',3'-cyclic phosphodiesterase [Solidesulfovibrio alcoholivorans]|uniref:RNA 2',3'-cyclic phosphodiesterase n=1 Tax=Solidesulfovibrio alcoholivorans TaxID=81406 RepID=UPI00049837CA|nr:RNA 2',3'-cyclic phosphodiesterase [Solidesulfovibrio alcoholivorans]